MIENDAKVNCFIEKEDDDDDEGCVLIFTNLVSQKGFTITLEFADITSKFLDLIDINNHYEIYDSEKDLISDLEKGHLERFMGEPNDNEKLDLLVNLRMKMKHQKGICDDQCILCNPNIGDDPFPDFSFDIRNAESEGEA